MPLFDSLLLFSDETPRGGADQMALDEALLESLDVPVLRTYRWDAPAVSFGYAQSLGEVARTFPGFPLVRRWTGGGMVEHGRDWTFSLIVPSSDPFAAVRPAETYRRIHSVVSAALGRETRLEIKRRGGHGVGGACFVQPVPDDILAIDGRKVCGGAQRRTRKGFLHQGSVQDCEWPADMARRVAEGLAGRRGVWEPNGREQARMAQLAVEKYGSAEWQGKIP